MAVPFIDLKRFEEGFLPTWFSKIEEMTKNTRFVGGPDVDDLEKNLAQDTGAKHAVACSSGTDAIQLALRALGVGRGDIVLIPDSTFWATCEAVVNVNADPVTVDINRSDLQMDFDLFREAVEKYKPKAAVLVHLYGWGSARLDDFRQYCKEKNVHLIEDGAQAYGVMWKGRSIYADAQVATVSFYPAKTLGAAGDAGAVFAQSAEVAEKMRSLANHGREQHYAHGDMGWNARCSSFQAAFLNIAIKHFPARLASRQKIAAHYYQELEKLGIQTMKPPAGYQENGYLNVTLHDAEKRNKLKDALSAKGIGVGVVYPGAIHDQKGAEGFMKGNHGDSKNSRWLASSVLNLPLFPYMTDSEFDEVISAIKASGIYG